MSLPYKEVDGNNNVPALTIYTLSYCSTCKAAKELLENRGFAYRYLVVDKLPRQLILQAKRVINKPGERSIIYPVLQINEDEFVHGYNETVWTGRIEAAMAVEAS